MKKIPLTHGKSAKVDDCDFKLVNQYKWHLHSQEGKDLFYARGFVDGKKILMHRFILAVTDKKIKVDHSDGNGLNNQRSNIRIADASQNGANRRKRRGKVNSQYLGVFLKRGKYWVAQLGKDKKLHIRYATSEIDAARKYNELAREHHGKFAKFNKV